MLKKIVCFFSCFTVLLLTACSDKSLEAGWPKAKFALVYTNSLQPKSELVFFDENGHVLESVKMKAQGIFDIEEDDQGTWIFPTQFDHCTYYLHRNGKLERTETKGHGTFAKENGQVKVVTHNASLYDNILTITYQGKVTDITLPSYLFAGSIDDPYLYVASAVVGGDSPAVFVIDYKKAKIVKRINIDEPAAIDIKKIGHKLLIANSGDQLVVIDTNTWKVDYIPLPEETMAKMLLDQDKIYIPLGYEDGKIVELNHHLDQLRTLDLHQSIYKVDQDEQFFYVMDQIHDNKNLAATVAVFEKKSGKKVKELKLPDRGGGMLVQDIKLLK
jgi:hypothetical protein